MMQPPFTWEVIERTFRHSHLRRTNQDQTQSGRHSSKLPIGVRKRMTLTVLWSCFIPFFPTRFKGRCGRTSDWEVLSLCFPETVANT